LPAVGLAVDVAVGLAVEVGADVEVGAVVGEPASVGSVVDGDVVEVPEVPSPPPSHAPRVVAKPNKSAIPRTLIFITPHFTNCGKYNILACSIRYPIC
jgi:hypothetical protein